MDLNLLKKKSVLILGLGREGESTLKFFERYFPEKSLGLADQRQFSSLSPSIKKLIQKRKKDKLFFGEKYLEAIQNYQIIIKTPGISFLKIKPYLKKRQIITSQTDIFLEKYKEQTIGITGTKGKGTTATLIYQILKQAKIKTALIGNIGKPSLDWLHPKKNERVFVFELSSHQLDRLKISPHIAVFLNFYREHLDYYKNLKDYFRAKSNIAKWQKKNDFFVFNDDFWRIRTLAQETKATLIPFSLKKELKKGVYKKDEYIYFRNEKILNIKKLPFLADCYLENVMASVGVAKILNIKNKIIQRAIYSFRPLEHRLEYVGRWQGIEFFNDSLATIPETTIWAIKSLKKVDTLIAGGHDRGQNFDELAKTIKKFKIRNIILFPPSGQRLKQKLQKNQKGLKIYMVKNMKEAVGLSFQLTKKGKICLLSPASASFGIFKNYKDRGKQFKKYIKIFAQDEKKK